MTRVLLTIAAAGLAALGGGLVAGAWSSRTARLVVFSVVAFGTTIGAFQLLGIISAISKMSAVRLPWVLVTSGAIALLCSCARRLVCGNWPLSRPLRRSPPATGERCGGRLEVRWPLIVVGGLAALLLPHVVMLGLSAPPRGWDVLAYHMPMALSWFQHGNLGTYGSDTAFYPGNGEIAILMSLFTGTDRLASLIQLPFLLLGTLSVYGIARELGVKRKAATAAAVVFLASPMVFFQSALAKNDLMVSGLLLAGTYMLARFVSRETRATALDPDLVVSGLAFGLAMGVKYSILPFCGLLVPVSLVLCIRSKVGGGPTRGGHRVGILRWLLFLLAMALPSAFWFGRNWVVAGNPFAPLSLGVVGSAFGRHDPSYVPNALAWLWFPWLDRAVEGSYSASSGFGAAFATLGPVSLAVCVWMCASRRLAGVFRQRCLLVLALVGLSVAAWWLGGHHLPRFLLPAMGLACAPIALLFDSVAHRVKLALAGLLVLAVLCSANETLRVVYRGDDLVSSHARGVTKAEHYHMPKLIYELPPRTRIMVLDMPGADVQRTFRYPVAGELPGNEVVMRGDLGVEADLIAQGPVAGHASLVRDAIDYVFLRTLALPPSLTVFDKYPDLYENVLDIVEEPYPWYRKGFLSTAEGGFGERAPAVTKIYRVRTHAPRSGDWRR